MALLQPRPSCAAPLLALAGSAALASEVSPVEARALSQILEAVEMSPSIVIVSANFEERHREVVSCSADGRSCREQRTDPCSAMTLRDSREMNYGRRPPAGRKTVAQTGRTIEEHKLGLTSAIEFDEAVWAVTVQGNGVRAKL
jgi:hypothetical protein